MDIYIVRTSILKSLTQSLHCLKGELLDIGCGKMPYRDYILNNSAVEKYIGLDIQNALKYDQNVTPDFTWDGKKMPFDKETFDCAFGTEVLEHCPEPEVVLNETWRVLKPGGTFFFTVPFLWNLHEVPHDEYRYTPFSMKRHLINTGFTNIQIHALGGWHLAMAQMIGLWLKRSPISRVNSIQKRLLSKFLMAFMKKLIRIGEKEKVHFTEGQMITGLYGLAVKP